jgi:hypothetical protein
MNIRQKDKMKVNLRVVKVTNLGRCTRGQKGRGEGRMKKIVELSKQNPVNYNQLFLWN